jgi:hypothetical protein
MRVTCPAPLILLHFKVSELGSCKHKNWTPGSDINQVAKLVYLVDLIALTYYLEACLKKFMEEVTYLMLSFRIKLRRTNK